MPSKVIAEANAYKAQLNKLLADGKVTKAEVNALEAGIRKGKITEVQAYELISWAEKNGDKFDSKAIGSLESWMRGTMAKYTTIEGETGVDQVPSGEPALAQGDAGKASWGKLPGALEVGGIGDDDVEQGQLGDCYFLASLEAVAHTNPKLLENAIRDNKDGTYTVSLWSRPEEGSAPRKVQVTVDGKLPESGGESRYATSRTGELWPMLFEKAYAAWNGGYENIQGGMATNALAALTGARPGWFPVDDKSSPTATFEQLQKLLKSGASVVASTQDLKREVPNVIEGHSYTVLGAVEQNGQKFVQLRNPWGSTEPGHDGKDDGIFLLPIADFVKAYGMVEYVKA